MIAIFSDTHSSTGHELEGAALTAAREADVVVHAGDFTSNAALEAFRDECDRLFAVHGNADSVAVRDRLPTARVVEAGGVRIAVTHRRDGGETGLAMFGRSRGADLVVFGHSHRPTVVETDDIVLLNPGSHADPRGNRPGFAVLEERGEGLEGEIREPDGTVLETVEFAGE
ncbi:phosphodiesterase, MJ0936 family protein [Natrinema pellirubrum DSM 15624]|uniref:Phosphoesterase n=1 Tax=Natrinema pellirubrum (strain DSM 15624 / CIP 106293 / JCM 10476 / NCIMB 786 / 157) TaxID=797303 RepID=L0JRL6_NATP1|nr:metallophosphoesterase [Natrinema pellirubrum]AGB33463.1 phosphoesterase, MJ0936 family [Natrinema pellirubrum DSM 15624]ELY71152.1 phosphodiesterase, MJ0936 family protein [Natrinema pellirubrum DSM 15624]